MFTSLFSLPVLNQSFIFATTLSSPGCLPLSVGLRFFFLSLPASCPCQDLIAHSGMSQYRDTLLNQLWLQLPMLSYPLSVDILLTLLRLWHTALGCFHLKEDILIPYSPVPYSRLPLCFDYPPCSAWTLTELISFGLSFPHGVPFWAVIPAAPAAL